MWIFTQLKETWLSYRRNQGPLLAAALAFYGLLSIAPLGVVSLFIAGIVLGESGAEAELEMHLRAFAGSKPAAELMRIVDETQTSTATGVAAVAGLLFLLYAATRLFVSLRMSLNQIWQVRLLRSPSWKHRTWRVAERRLVALLLLLALGAMLLVAAGGHTLLSFLSARMAVPTGLWRLSELGIELFGFTTLISLVFRFCADARMAWRDIFFGASLTAILASLGSMLIGKYVGDVATNSAHGAAGATVMVLLWLYYNAQIFYLGASFTVVWSRHHGRGPEPLRHVEVVER